MKRYALLHALVVYLGIKTDDFGHSGTLCIGQ
jgi:hypothetical protein